MSRHMTDNVVQTAQVLRERYGPSYRWLVTISGMVGVVSMVLAMTTVNVAVPDVMGAFGIGQDQACLLYTSPSPRDRQKSRMPSSA